MAAIGCLFSIVSFCCCVDSLALPTLLYANLDLEDAGLAAVAVAALEDLGFALTGLEFAFDDSLLLARFDSTFCS